ncbi:hypothetical protein EIN_222300 [Entamoeba invadens IP1]|uniref:TLDc domain-containing protein n=1 Tax=Entamoeba invadens IP1 TaxID=370355 RepID=A0A0A1U211_ENTIV|nr:hypothetical protein EIN_222300 [Entamoeba invadens IP1]ELP88087.1 hypothetical protein EIN_222300 [Entamoeba invadens IP1]|eukprot:XP_004254858.1 hypothetical protein EIN_222300 [Entamoeba invadens IP1]
MDFELLRIQAVKKNTFYRVESAFEQFKALRSEVLEQLNQEEDVIAHSVPRKMMFSELEKSVKVCEDIISTKKELIAQMERDVEFLHNEIIRTRDSVSSLAEKREVFLGEMKIIDQSSVPKRSDSDGEYSPREHRVYEKVDKKYPSYPKERDDEIKKFKPLKPRTNEENNLLLTKTMGKVLKRVKMTNHKTVFDSALDGKDLRDVLPKINGRSGVMIIVFPTLYEPFGCFIDNEIKGSLWSGDIHSFVCCFAEEQFFWVYKFVTDKKEDRGVFRFGESSDDFLFQITPFISVSKDFNDCRVSDELKYSIETRKGNFLGSSSSTRFTTSRFIVIQFN